MRARGDMLFDPSTTLLDCVSTANLRSLFIANPSAPNRLAMQPDSQRLWVAHNSGVAIVDISNCGESIVGTIDLGPAVNYQGSVAFSPDGSMAYAGLLNNVYYIDVASQTVVGQLTIGTSELVILGFVSFDGGVDAVLVKEALQNVAHVLDPTTAQELRPPIVFPIPNLLGVMLQ